MSRRPLAGASSSRRILSTTAPCSPMTWLSQGPGRPAMIAEFPRTNRQAFSAINIAIDIYFGRSEACGADQYSPSQWVQTIKNLGLACVHMGGSVPIRHLGVRRCDPLPCWRSPHEEPLQTHPVRRDPCLQVQGRRLLACSMHRGSQFHRCHHFRLLRAGVTLEGTSMG